MADDGRPHRNLSDEELIKSYAKAVAKHAPAASGLVISMFPEFEYKEMMVLRKELIDRFKELRDTLKVRDVDLAKLKEAHRKPGYDFVTEAEMDSD